MRNTFVSAVAMAVATLAHPGAARAQIATPPEADQSRDGEASGEIIVTAQRRSESLTNVPISISAVSADQLAKTVTISTQDLTNVVPGLFWARSTNFNQPTVRGVGTRNASAGDEPNVAVYLDGVYLPDSLGTLFDLANIERIEVLKGPQGTLFGRNATGGAISLVTQKPRYDWQGSASATYGRYDYYRGSAYITGPLVPDVLAFSLSGIKYGDDGYVKNINLGTTQGESDGTLVRGRLLLDAAPNLSFQLNGFYAKVSNNVLLSPYSINGNNQARQQLANPILNPTNLPASTVIASAPYTTSNAVDPVGRVKQRLVDGHFDWDIGFASLSGLASFGTSRGHNFSYSDYTPFLLTGTFYDTRTKARNQELVLTSNDDKSLSYIAGVTLFQGRARSPLGFSSRIATSGAYITGQTIYGQNTNSVAAFAETTIQPVTRFFVTGGLRYTSERKSAFNTTVATNVTTQGSERFHNLSPRVVARYELTDSSNVYASFTRGFKSGTFNAVTAVGATLPVGPEKIGAFEAGYKGQIAPGIRATVAAYRYNYTGLQVSTLVDVNGASLTTLQNAATAHIKGVEATLNAQVIPALSLNSSISFLDASFSRFPRASVQLPRTGAAGVLNNGNVASFVDAGGNDLIRAPRFTFTVGADYEQPAFGGFLSLNVNAFFSSKYYGDVANTIVQPHYEVINASATWRADKKSGFYATVFVQNLTNQAYAATFAPSSFGTFSQVNKPRWAGGTVGFNF
jgi:iron complex outermembrane receptor protein